MKTSKKPMSQRQKDAIKTLVQEAVLGLLTLISTLVIVGSMIYSDYKEYTMQSYANSVCETVEVEEVEADVMSA